MELVDSYLNCLMVIVFRLLDTGTTDIFILKTLSEALQYGLCGPCSHGHDDIILVA